MNARNTLRFFALLAATLVSACGGGGGHDASVHQLAPSITYPQVSGFVVGAGITPLVPVTTGSLSGFHVEPPLPAGMMIVETTGAIFGTPTVVAPTTTYVVQATSGSDLIAGTVTFTVREVVPEISYAITSWDLVQNVPSQCIVPTLRGGAVGTWSIDRPLPPGLLFDLNNGQICGTPTEASPRTNYVVTGMNSTGSSSATLAIAVQAMSSTGGAALQVGKRALDRDSAGHGMLWWQLAVDGSYVAAATGEQLIVWAPTGETLFSKVGNYGDAMVFAAAGELRIAAGAAGAHVIETIAVPTGISRVSVPYLGSFQSWSEDGEKFLADMDDSAWIYSRDATQFAIAH